jgi:hypothetical protein
MTTLSRMINMSYVLDPAFLLSGPVIGSVITYVCLWQRWGFFNRTTCTGERPCTCYDYSRVWKYWLLVIGLTMLAMQVLPRLLALRDGDS